MNYILKFLIIFSTIFSISKTVLSEELIIWSRGGWSDWMVEGFNKKMATIESYKKGKIITI